MYNGQRFASIKKGCRGCVLSSRDQHHSASPTDGSSFLQTVASAVLKGGGQDHHRRAGQCGEDHSTVQTVSLTNFPMSSLSYSTFSETLLKKLFHLDSVVVTTPTIGSNVESITYKNINFLMWVSPPVLFQKACGVQPRLGSSKRTHFIDIGGQESLRTSWATYYINTKAVIMVIDSTDKERLHIARKELHQMMETESLQKASLLIFANKQDVQGALSAAQISDTLSLTSLKDRQWHIQGQPEI
ncbi:ADP-ribosylation factor family-domain-containing protein [Endogone sp. FLAS-F59071]|nr:ADP-ribosylation factor family-domain-containing protein [Endogone sp. FLAS-F59071]|eukprot:RUS14141.1 ADP-ribosylation factor family-domain-containing protein [Endogone sp. FLAS-F59071]